MEEAANQVAASEKRAATLAIAAKAAHDLSQPLMAAMGNVELVLLQANLDATNTRQLERAYEQLERLRDIVNDFVRVAARRVAT